MEFPHLGRNCAFGSCNRLDFLPMKCGACLENFCSDHFSYTSHECPAPNNRDVQVPSCPLCGVPVPGRRGEAPDVAVGEHIDNQCMSDPAKERRKKAYTNRCALKGCQTKELVPVVCSECSLNFCIKHRHTVDHACEGEAAAKRRQAAEAAMARLASGQSKKIEFQTKIASHAGRSRVVTLGDVKRNAVKKSENEMVARTLSMSLQGAGLGGGEVAVARELVRHVGGIGSVFQQPTRRNRYNNAYNYGRGDNGFNMTRQNIIEIMKILGAVLLLLYVITSVKYFF